jgi:uncharacterized protein
VRISFCFRSRAIMRLSRFRKTIMHPYLQSLLGGLLIGCASWLLLAAVGRVAGISGIITNAFTERSERDWRWAFIAGLIAGGAVFTWLFNANTNAMAGAAVPRSPGILIAAGLLVGVGTVIGSGCTSGHGVCGLSRGSIRSLAATITFMLAGIVTVALLRLFGGFAQ